MVIIRRLPVGDVLENLFFISRKDYLVMTSRKQLGLPLGWIFFYGVVISTCGAWGLIAWQTHELKGWNLILAKLLTLVALPVGFCLVSLSIYKFMAGKK
jgi:hypothetical protein